jgi:phosphoglycolate phosphatase
MGDAGADPGHIANHMAAIVESAQEIYGDLCPDLRDKVCNGVPEFLAVLEQRGVPAGLVTGNLTGIGWRKLTQAGLRHYFSFGAFAEMGDTRSELVRLAIETAKHLALADQHTRITLIGDHPNDIEAAHNNGIPCVAVSTGLVTYQELSQYNPDYLVEDLRSFDLLRLF